MIHNMKRRLFNKIFRWWVCCWLLSFRLVFADEGVEELWFSAQLNQLSSTQTLVFLRQKDGRLLISKSDWQQWRLKLPTVAAYKYEAEEYYYLDQIQGLTYRVNESDLSITLEANLALFETLQMSAASSSPIMNIDTSWGGFVNYDIATQINQQGLDNVSVLLENGVFSHWGALNNQFLIDSSREGSSQITRLDTTFSYDNLPNMTTLNIGDMVSTDLGLQGSARLFGIQLLRNFGLRPKLLLFPLPTMSGEALAPSTVDIWVNNMRALSRQVPTGAFTIEDVPIISGKGEARMVIKDLLGREQVVTLPYYVSAELLKVGLHEYSYDLGVIRENYGSESQNYGRMIASVTDRVGVTNYMTAQLQALLSKQQQNISYGGVFVLPRWGAVQTLIGHSQNQTYGLGHSASLSVSTQPWGINIGSSIRLATKAFTSLASNTNTPPLKLSTQLFVSMPLPYFSGALSSVYSHQESYQQEKISLLQLGYNTNIGKWATLSASVAKVFNVENSKLAAQLSLNIPLGGIGSANVGIQSQQKLISIQRSMSSGVGWGYDFTHVSGDSNRTNASLFLQNGIGRYNLKASQYAQGDINVAASMAGGVAIMDKKAFLSRRISNSFALVKVGDFANVRVYKQNQLMGKTNKEGFLLVPQLLPYQKNKLRIDGGDLPFDVDIPEIEKEIVPASRSGIKADFAVKRSYGASLVIKLENGDIMPAGARIYNATNNEDALVGFRGEAYLTNLQPHNTIKIHWLNNVCQFELSFTPLQDGTVPDLGIHVCHKVAP